MQQLRMTLKNLRKYRSLAAGVVIVIIFVVVSVYTVIAIPYSEAVRLWRATPGVWDHNPVLARPVWFDWFTADKLPRTFVASLEDEGVEVTERATGDGMKTVEAVIPFEYDYDGFPSELQLWTGWDYDSTRPVMSVYLRKPDGELITLGESQRVRREHIFYISQQTDLRARLGGTSPEVGLFARDISVPRPDVQPMQGRYELIIRASIGEDEELLEAELRVFGRVEGWAGTDNRRRDLMIPLLWGAPIGLMFGILAAVGAQLSTFVLAGISTWFGGKLEKSFQWITQVNIILPVLPILIMISHFYAPRLWTILGLVILLNVFSAGMITYRAMFLQLKEAPYIEAAQAYGSGGFRIIFRYLLPRIAPTLLPQFVLVIPGFVFLEATLAVLGLGDPDLPTWGKVLNDAYTGGALYFGHYYWMILPSTVLMLIGFGFALVGYSLDRIFNPRLRTQ